MDFICTNPGLKFIAEHIFTILDSETILICRLVNSKWKGVVDDPNFCLGKVFLAGEWCLKNFKRQFLEYEESFERCSPETLLKYIPGWHAPNDQPWYDVQDFEGSLNSFKESWKKFVFKPKNDPLPPWCYSRNPLFYLMRLYKVIDNLKYAFRQCNLKNYPYELQGLLHSAPEWYEIEHYWDIWKVLTEPIVEFLDLELMFRLNYLDYRPRTFDNDQDCLQFRISVQNQIAKNKKINDMGRPMGMPFTIKWNFKVENEEHEFDYGYVFDDYYALSKQHKSSDAWVTIQQKIEFGACDFWPFLRFQDDPKKIRSYTKEVILQKTRDSVTIGCDKRSKLWLVYNSKTCLEHRISRNRINNWNEENDPIRISHDVFSARHTHFLKGTKGNSKWFLKYCSEKISDTNPLCYQYDNVFATEV